MERYQSGHLIREKAKGNTNYIQCPVDDFEAFMYTFLYALILRKLSPNFPAPGCKRARLELYWIKRLKEAKEEHREWLLLQLRDNITGRTSCKNNFEVSDVFWESYLVAIQMRKDWISTERRVGLSEKMLKHWHIWAYKGGAEMLEVFVRHKKKIERGARWVS